MLELDYTNVLDSVVGPSNGIPKIAFEKAARSTTHLIADLEKLRSSGMVGFADVPFDDDATKTVMKFAAEHDYPNVLIIGIGGSALGPAAVDAALTRQNSGKRLIVLDNIDPDFIRDTLDTLEPADTIVNVIAKSGVTAETMSTFAVVHKWMVEALGPSECREHFAITTD